MSALAAVLAVTMVLSLYAGVYDDTIPDHPDAPPAAATADRLVTALSTGGVIDPSELSDATIAATVPDSVTVTVTLHVDGHRWSVGPTPPDDATRTARTVPVRWDDDVTLGHLQVVVWT